MVTIFIHGTLPPEPIRNLPVLDKFFFCPQGLILAETLQNISGEKNYHLAQVPFVLYQSDPENFDLKDFYLFGWSGALSPKARLEAALLLYNNIKELNLHNIRLITHSHGGNVALNLKVIAEKHNDNKFKIDELILLACPVQKQTSNYINSHIFKKKYSFHSHLDIIQVIDPQGFHDLYENLKTNNLNINPIFSKRHFNRKDNVVQIQTTINNRNLLHIEFLLTKFLNFLPVALKTLNFNKKNCFLKKNKEIYLDIETGFYKNIQI